MQYRGTVVSSTVTNGKSLGFWLRTGSDVGIHFVEEDPHNCGPAGTCRPRHFSSVMKIGAKERDMILERQPEQCCISCKGRPVIQTGQLF